MRTSLWPGLLAALIHNQNRQQRRVRLFECGAKYQRHAGAIAERRVVAGVAAGSAYPEQWGVTERAVDFYDVKGDLEALLGSLGRAGACEFVPDPHPALHPGQAAALRLPGGGHCGRLGRLHPEVARALGVEQDVVLFELELDALPPAGAPLFRELSKFPAIRRDLAIIVNERVPARAIEDCIRATGGELLQALHLFDVYRGTGVAQGSKSVALGLTLQDFSRTLTDDEIDALIAKVVDRLRELFGAALRDK